MLYYTCISRLTASTCCLSPFAFSTCWLSILAVFGCRWLACGFYRLMDFLPAGSGIMIFAPILRGNIQFAAVGSTDRLRAWRLRSYPQRAVDFCRRMNARATSLLFVPVRFVTTRLVVLLPFDGIVLLPFDGIGFVVLVRLVFGSVRFDDVLRSDLFSSVPFCAVPCRFVNSAEWSRRVCPADRRRSSEVLILARLFGGVCR